MTVELNSQFVKNPSLDFVSCLLEVNSSRRAACCTGLFRYAAPRPHEAVSVLRLCVYKVQNTLGGAALEVSGPGLRMQSLRGKSSIPRP